LSRYARFYSAIDYHATEIDIFDTGLAQTRNCELPPGAEILIVFFSNISILSHTPAIEELIGTIRMAPRFTPKSIIIPPIARGMLEHSYRREQKSHHVENKGERKKRTLTVVPDVDGSYLFP
jgi:hypothetical protein